MKKYNKKIDVIIPAYNVPDNILSRCLASIACQDIIEDVEVTIVDDASMKQMAAQGQLVNMELTTQVMATSLVQTQMTPSTEHSR